MQTTILSTHSTYAEAVSAASCRAFEMALTKPKLKSVRLDDTGLSDTPLQTSEQSPQHSDQSKKRTEKIKALGVKSYLSLTPGASGSA